MRAEDYGELWVCTCSLRPPIHMALPTVFSDEESSCDTIEAVEVLFLPDGTQIDSRTGLPWAMTQQEFDAKNDEYQRCKARR